MLPSPMSPRRRICPVTVVPMFAPIITGTAWASFIIPAFTKPTTMTTVAVELCITPVTTAPRATPFIRLFVSFSRVFSRLAPATLSRLAPRRLIP